MYDLDPFNMINAKFDALTNVLAKKMEDLSMLVSSSSSAGSSQQVAYAEGTTSCGVDYGEQAYIKKPVESEETLSFKASAPTYPLTDIDAATDGFNHRRVIGKGRLGTVYAALLPREELVAVKRIHPSLVLSNAGCGFSSILKTLSLAQHPNILPILGFSQAPGERIIVMEFVDMASLDFHLHENSDGGFLLDWSSRLRVAAGAARGLEYLHERMAPNVIHGCFKASNILLDVKFSARVCDYGLSFLAPKERRYVAGCVDEEYWREIGGGPCKASDVYGFGVVLLELLTGRRMRKGYL
ncbi:hypothetical protein GH714_016312 [Hevea brasiliensis]|uniref:Protein kinase domain-containing protein n=1 Tax=Hevea brasiliensis TaxID=3981 RepID=A0A6A6LUI7_HEVBR|nr:hypothetical protein GH714_016312 [Hevea brasiliensis]